MIIGVLSPVHGQGGNSTAALITALLLSKKYSVCLTNLSGKEDNNFFEYIGANDKEDITCTASQIISLLASNSISSKDIKDYCLSVNENLDIFSGIEAADNETKIIEKFPYDFVVVDIDINPELPAAKYVIDISDTIVITLSQSANVIHRYKKLLSHSDISKKSLYICNRYSTTVGSISAFSRSIDINQKQCFTLHNCGKIMRYANAGNLLDLFSKIDDIPDLKADLSRLETALMKLKNNEVKE